MGGCCEKIIPLDIKLGFWLYCFLKPNIEVWEETTVWGVCTILGIDELDKIPVDLGGQWKN